MGLSSHNFKHQVSSKVPSHNQFIEAQNLESQKWLNDINVWTKKQKMLINENKSSYMIFNPSTKYQFTTELKLNNQPLEIVEYTTLLGTIISNDLKWDLNCEKIVKKANARLQLLRKVSSFGASIDELKTIYILFVRSLLEQSCVVWHSSLSVENRTDLERIQKTALKLILGSKYELYENALNILGIETLDERREQLCLRFAKKSAKHPKFSHLFPKNLKEHKMTTRNCEKFKVEMAKNERLKKSAIIYMQNLLNENN